MYAHSNPPVRGHAEEIKKEVRQPGAERPAAIARDRVGRAVRPARIGALEGGEDQQQVQPRRDQKQPSCFAEQARQAGGKRRAAFAPTHEAVPVPRYPAA